MSERRSRQITLRKWADFCVTAQELIAEITAMVELVPPEFREKVIVEFDRRNSDYGELTAHYVRPETDDEMASRIAQSEAWKRQEEERERKRYERLKEKFGQ